MQRNRFQRINYHQWQTETAEYRSVLSEIKVDEHTCMCLRSPKIHYIEERQRVTKTTRSRTLS